MEQMDRLIKAKYLVAQYVNGNLEGATKPGISPDDLSVVWFSKTLKNHKTILVSTTVMNLIFEVTYNGEAEETYLDVYQKLDNICIPD